MVRLALVAHDREAARRREAALAGALIRLELRLARRERAERAANQRDGGIGIQIADQCQLNCAACQPVSYILLELGEREALVGLWRLQREARIAPEIRPGSAAPSAEAGVAFSRANRFVML